MLDAPVRALLYVVSTGLLAGGGLGIYRLLRLQRRETSMQIDTAQRINEGFEALLARYEREVDRLGTALDECHEELRRGRRKL